MADVERRVLAPGLEISRVLTGLWQIADMERGGTALEAETAADAMEPYVTAGLTTFDMADHYGSAEDVAGTFRARPGNASRVQLLTKWVPPPGPMTPRRVRDAVERALGRLRTDAIDLLQFHAWAYDDASWLDALFALDELRREGLVRHVGLTNVDGAHLAMVLHTGIPVVSDQVCFSLLDRRAAGALTQVCEEHGVGILAYGTLAGGLLGEAWLGRPEPRAGELPTWSLMKYKRFIEAAPGGWAAFQGVLAAAARVADKHGVSVANVASRWVLDQPSVAGIIVGARLGRSDHVADNLRTFGWSLDEEDRTALATALEALGNPPGEPGDEYRRPPFLTASGDLSHHLDALPAPFPVVEAGTRRRALSGTIWEDLCGFSRATRVGNRVLVSGTTATHGDRVIGGSDAAAQALFCLDKIEGALRSLGARREDVVRTRIYVRNVEDWEAVSRVHGARFAGVQPANTLVQAGIIGEEYLVEIEAEAIVEGRDAA